MENQEIYTIIIVAVASYLSGSVPYGYLIGKMKGIDIRQHGSCNIGATNVTRVIGKGWGKLCFACDFFKGFLPVFLVALSIGKGWITDTCGVMTSVATLCAVMGHIFPVWLGFKGGKGVAVAAGAIFAFCPYSLLAGLALWGLTFYTSRYVSLASILAAAFLPVFCFVFSYVFSWEPGGFSGVRLGLLIFIALLTILKHSSNIKRLLNGTENRFEKKKKAE